MTLIALPTSTGFGGAGSFAADEAVSSVGVGSGADATTAEADDFGDSANGVESGSVNVAQEAAAFPQSVYQFGTGVRFDEILGVVPEIARDGFDSILLAPVSLPSSTRFVSADGRIKHGSSYGPVDIHRINPVVAGIMSRESFLRGDRLDYPVGTGWERYGNFVSATKASGIPHVGADMVMGHTARDPGTIAWYEGKFGLEVYERDYSRSDGIAVRRGLESTGYQGPWDDTAPLNFVGAARGRLLRHQTEAFVRNMKAGVDLFRLDAAQYLLPGNYLHDLLTSVKHRAGELGVPRPRFIAEVLGDYDGVQDDMINAIKSGADAVFASTHWWNLRDPWYVALHNRIHDFGGRMVAFPSNADTPRKLGLQELIMRALLAGATASYTYMQGAHYGEKPTVFLGELSAARSIDLYFGKPSMAAAVTQNALRMLNALKGEPVFSDDKRLSMDVHGPLTVITKADKRSEQTAIIAIHTGMDEHGVIYGGKLSVSVPFEGAGILYANNQHVGWIPHGRDSAGNLVHEFELIPYGIAVFYQPRADAAMEFAQQVAMGGRTMG